MAEDVVLQQLKKLREGAGLTPGRLAQCPDLLSALATSDPQEAYDSLIAQLAGLNSRQHRAALQVDYGITLEATLGREPAERERALLGERRSGYAEVVQRDVKTLQRWSEAAVRDLRSRLLVTGFDGVVVVVGAVRNDRLLGITVSQLELQEPRDPDQQEQSHLNPRTIDTQYLENTSSGPSMPCMLYAFPRDWRPAELQLAVVFQGEWRPERAWCVVSESLLTLPYGQERYPVELREDTAYVRVLRPRRDRVYGIWWNGTRTHL